MKNKILVIGATGMLGEPVAKRLHKDGFSVKVFTRKIERAKELFDDSFDITEGDITDVPSIESALKGCSGIHINLSGVLEQVGVQNITAAAKNKNIEKISYVSGTSVAEETTWFPQTKRKYWSEDAIKRSGIPYTIFCPTWFMESIPKFVKDGKAYLFGRQPNRYHFIAADDFTRMVSVSYREEKASNKRLFIHGPEAWYFLDALKKYCELFHPEIKKINVIPYFIANFIAVIAKKEAMKNISNLMSFIEKAGERGNPAEANTILGAPEINLSDWMEKREKYV
ncbi:MAG: NAD(P)H-binding protein [Melioribacteraceae bacterium]|nr:NAD(P)H-binding protein [Melioribacteraceae bacterium]MCF8353016.1 NAD(P)H-binding protein [Melioribacteraceae bacterium]MCF8392907.1 NAD(P)H-binding protein [Melioribacteraceae bacterium]MCF8417799.1 NAD(P)H-binding protein [Melioribacteraceae bacterium]